MKIHQISVAVKIQIFKWYCIHLYGSALWYQFSSRVFTR